MSTQKIALFAPTSEVGRRIAEEALSRGHNVTAVVSNENEFKLKHPNLKVVEGDVRKKEVVSKYAKGHDVVICAHEPSIKNPREHVEITRNIIEGVKETGVPYFVSAAHPFTPRIEGTQESYNTFKPLIQAQEEALKLLKKEKGLSWGYVHTLEPTTGQKAGEYRVSNEVVFSQPHGDNRVAIKDYTNAILDEAEKSQLEIHGMDEERNGLE